MQSIFAKRAVPFETDKDFNAYIAKKRSTDGMRYTWSDSATANGVAATCGKGPILQVIYPIYRNGEPCPEIPPKFYFLTKTGDRTKLPIFIHYNGINHYNAIVPASWPAPQKRSVSPRQKAFGMVSPKGGSKPMPFA